MAPSNPYQPPQTPVTPPLRSLPGYAVVGPPRGWLGFSSSNALLKLLQECGERGERLVASCTESSDRYHLVFKVPELYQAGVRKYSYRLVKAPRAKALSKNTAGTLANFMAAHYPELDVGWTPIAYISNSNQLVLTKVQDLPPESQFEEYLIAHVPPVWWRTLFGFSFLRIIAEELTKIAAGGYEVITYIGEDRYLLGKRESCTGTPCVSYRLLFMGNLFVGNVFEVLLRGYARACEKLLERMATQGWELVTFSSPGFLFKSQSKDGG